MLSEPIKILILHKFNKVRLEIIVIMLSYTFTNIGSASLYEHLYKFIKKDILEGILSPHYKLPSKRTFAKNLGISVITVETAYSQLIAEGYVYSIPKKGFYVSDIHSLIPEHKSDITEENVRLSSGNTSYLADFTNNQTNADNFPFSIWAKLMRETLTDMQPNLMTTPPCGGVYELRLAIAKHLLEFRNMAVAPEQIIIGAGTEYLYGLLVQLLGYDKIYAVENPGYHKISSIYNSHQVTCKYIPMDSYGVIVEDIEKAKVDILHISPSHHFPTGMITPIGRRYELLGWASKSDSRYIIEDEYDSEFRFTGQQIPTMQSIDVLEKVIYMNTFSKSLASTIRISYMILPKHLMNRFFTDFSFYSCTVSTFEQYTLAKFIQGGYFEKHLNRMRNHYHAKRDSIIAAIKNSSLGNISTISEADSGLHFLLKMDTDLSDDNICKLAEEKGIKLPPLSLYYKDNIIPEALMHTFLINYSSLTSENMGAVAEQIYGLIK